MAESTLSLSRDDIRSALAVYLGWTVPASWSATQELQAGIIVAKGIRQAYSPPVLPGERKQHEWSFLSPWASFSTTSGVADYELPEDYAGMTDDMTFISENAGPRTIRLVPDVRIRQMQQGTSDLTGFPEFGCVVPLPSDGTTPQRWQLTLHPAPDGEYELRYRYQSNPNNISSSKTYPLGGLPFADVLMASVIAAAEVELNDEQGMRYGEFMQKLQAAISMDRSRNLQSLGVMTDPSMGCPDEFRYATTLTYNGDVL